MIVSAAAVKQTRVKRELCLSLSTMSAPSSWGHQLVFIDLVEAASGRGDAAHLVAGVLGSFQF